MERRQIVVDWEKETVDFVTTDFGVCFKRENNDTISLFDVSDTSESNGTSLTPLFLIFALAVVLLSGVMLFL